MERPVRVYLMRHAKTVESWRTVPDAPLGEVGHGQARKAARDLAPLGPLPLWSSPLRRARETAHPLATLWNTDIRIEPRIAEIPAPGTDPKVRGDWLMRTLASRWLDMDADLRAWRDDVLDTIRAVREDTVMVTHYVVINAVVGAATNDDRVICFHPDNTDTTVIERVGGRLTVVGYTLDGVSEAALAG